MMVIDKKTASKQLDNSLVTAYEKAAGILEKADPAALCLRTGASFRENTYIVTFLHSNYVISMPQVTFEEQNTMLILQVMILHYLTAQGNQSVRGEFLSFSSIKGGMFYYHSFKKRVLEKLTLLFQEKKNKLITAVEELGKGQWAGADYSAVIPIFPKLDILMQFYPEDDEFPASANILFSHSFVNFLPIEDMAFLGGYVLKTIEKIVKRN